MFCDLVGSTSLAERYDPEDLGDIVRAYQDACAGVVSRYEGYVARYMGDGMLVYFGYPRAHEDDAERALHSGLEILERVDELQPRIGLTLQTRIGVATGLVVVGETVGQSSSQEQVVMGETPNLAARLQGVAEPGQLIAAQVTRQLAGELFEFSDLGNVNLKGFAALQPAWWVKGRRDSESRFEARRSARQLPLVGREQELDLLQERWRQATLGEGQMVVLSGEAGIGKSRITQALMDGVSEQHHVRIRYQCSPYHGDSALYPAIQHLLRAASITGGESNDEALDKLEVMAARVDACPLSVVPLFAALLGFQVEERYGKSNMTPQRQRAETLAAFVERLRPGGATDGRQEGLRLHRDRRRLRRLRDLHPPERGGEHLGAGARGRRRQAATQVAHPGRARLRAARRPIQLVLLHRSRTLHGRATDLLPAGEDDRRIVGDQRHEVHPRPRVGLRWLGRQRPA